MKILNASPGFSPLLTKEDIISFLSHERHNIYLGTLDGKQEPNIHPTWYYYNKKNDKIYVETAKNSKKVQNISNANSDTIYFCVDDSTPPYKGVRGKGKTSLLSDSIDFNLGIAEKIMIKYLGSLDNPMARVLLDNVRKGNSLLIEITPLYFSAWDYGKNN